MANFEARACDLHRSFDRNLHLLIDLDGTLVDSNKSELQDVKSGRDRRWTLANILSVDGAEQFIEALKHRGHSVTIVSDSHGAYVGPLAEQRFRAPWLALADKPNTFMLRAYLEREFGFPDRSISEEFLFVGDTELDIHLARGLSIPSAMIDLRLLDHSQDPYLDTNAERVRRYQAGASYNCRSFEEVLAVVDSPAECRLVLEDTFGTAAARLYTARNANGGLTLVRGLARQQQGPCDAYGAIARYYKFGSENRTDEVLRKTADDVSRYLRTQVLSYGKLQWDLVTCVADKETSKPPRKMAQLLHALEVDMPKEELFAWTVDVKGSIRQEKTRNGRMQFIKRFVRLGDRIDLRGKNVIIVDDQYTTGATAISHADMLLSAGVRNVLFVALFYLTNEVPVETVCPRCGKFARVKYRKQDGGRFHSCVPPEYNGEGCGWIRNIDFGNVQS